MSENKPKKKIKSFNISEEALDLLDKMKRKEGTSESEVVDRSIKAYFNKKATFLDKIKNKIETYIYLVLFFILMIISVIAGCFLYEEIKSLL